jgi:hypothetical protein
MARHLVVILNPTILTGPASSGNYKVDMNLNINFQNQVSLHFKWLVYDFRRPPLWSSGQSSQLQIQWSGLDSRHYQIF